VAAIDRARFGTSVAFRKPRSTLTASPRSYFVPSFLYTTLFHHRIW